MNTAGAAQALLRSAAGAYQDNPRALRWLQSHLARFQEPLRLAVLGGPATGKTTVVRALVGEHAAAEYAADGTSWYHTGELTVIDIPAAEPGKLERQARAGCTDADALLYLVANPYRTGCDGLRAAHRHPIAASNPVSALTVLSRADELGSGRIDALIAARQVARRYRHGSEVREFTQDVIPVGGLVASAATTLDQQEFAALTALANAPRAELDAALLSVDRFTRPDAALPIAARTRESLLARLGVFGLRLAVALIRQGADSGPKLAAQLAQRSGLDELRDSIQRHFTDRAEVLKARQALIGLDTLLRGEAHPAAAGLLAELDRILASAHEYAELRLLGDLQAERVSLPDELEFEAARILGGRGTDPADRLALDARYPPTDARYRQAVFGALWRWREHAEDPRLAAAQRYAAATVVRSCEEMAVAALSD